MPERTVQIVNKNGLARAAGRGDREARGEVPERDHHREGRSRRERQEHHGRDDARRRAGSDDHLSRRRAATPIRRSMPLRRSSATSSERAEWIESSSAFLRRRASPSARCICCAGRFRRSGTASFPTTRFPREIQRLHDALERAQERLRQVRDRVEHAAGPQEAAIFDVQRSILERPGADRRGRGADSAESRRRKGVRDRDVRVGASDSAAPRIRCCASGSAI